MTHVKIVATSLVAIAFTGCASFSPEKIVSQPNEITLENALSQVGAGLKKMHQAEEGLKFGLIPSEIVVTFNLSASAKDSGKLAIDLSRSVPEPVKTEAKAGGSIETSSAGDRSNTMTVKFINILMIPKDLLAQTKSPEELSKLLVAWEGSGVTPPPENSGPHPGGGSTGGRRTFLKKLQE